jgi:hypothetical protein
MSLSQRFGGSDSLSNLAPLPKKQGYVVKHPWTANLSDFSTEELNLREKQQQSAQHYKFKQPWDEKSTDILEEFEKQAEIHGTKVKQ